MINLPVKNTSCRHGGNQKGCKRQSRVSDEGVGLRPGGATWLITQEAALGNVPWGSLPAARPVDSFSLHRTVLAIQTQVVSDYLESVTSNFFRLSR